MGNASFPYDIKGKVLTSGHVKHSCVLNLPFVILVVLLPDRTAHNCEQKAHPAGHSNESVQSFFYCVTGANGYKLFLL